MKAGRKLSPATQIKHLKREIVELKEQIGILKRGAKDADIRLNEARRRTIPYGDRGQTLNFLPGRILTIRTDQEQKTWESLDGTKGRVYGKVIATFEVEGDIVSRESIAAERA